MTMKHITVDAIIREGCAGTNFTPADIRGPSGIRPVVKLRQWLMARAYQECKEKSLAQIGRAFGGRDHKTVFHAVKKHGLHHSQTGEKRKYIDHRRKAA